MPDPLYLYIYIYIYILSGLVGFYGISTIAGYLMPILFIYICIGLVGFYCISTIVDYLMQNPFYIYMYWFGWVLLHINYCRLFNAKSFLYIYVLVWLGSIAYQLL